PQLLERRAVAAVAGDHGHARGGRRTQRRLPRAAFEERPLADEGARPDLRDLLAVDLDREDTVQEQVELVARCTLLDERLPRLQPLPLRRSPALHHLAREAPLALALRPAAAHRLDEPDRIVRDLRLGAQRVVGDAGEDHVLRAELEGRRAEERLPGLAVVDDAAVLDLGPRLEEVRLAEPILVPKPG